MAVLIPGSHRVIADRLSNLRTSDLDGIVASTAPIKLTHGQGDELGQDAALRDLDGMVVSLPSMPL
jgi:hypothetical protein